MKSEREIDYVARTETVDHSSRWNSEAGYFNGMGDDGDSSSWVDAFKEVLPAVASVYQQSQFNKMNRDLINAGRAPIAAETYMATQPVTAKVAVGPNADAQKWMMYAGIGILALVGLRAAKVI